MTVIRAVLLALVGSLALVPSAIADTWAPDIVAPQYFAVSVEQIDRSVAWYRQALGLRELDDTSDEGGKWRIVNLANDDLFVEVIWDSRHGPAGRHRGIVKVGFRVPDVDVVADRVQQALGERPRVLDFRRHAVRIVQLRDPDRNIIQLSSPLVVQNGDNEE